MKKVWASILAAAMILSLAACGGTPSSTSTTPADTAPSTSDTTTSDTGTGAETIKVGVLSLETGNLATMGMNCYYATELAIEQINATGGVNGKMIEPVYADTAGDTTAGVELAKKFIDDPEIKMIFGPVRGLEGTAIGPITNDAGIVMLLNMTSQDDVGEVGPYVWVGGSENRHEQPAIAKILEDYGATSIVVAYKNTEWGADSYQGFLKGIEETNIEVLAAEPYSETETDFTSMLTKLRSYNADGIYLCSEVSDGCTILSQIYQMGWEIDKYAPGAMYNGQVMELAGEEAAEGLRLGACAFIDPESDFYKEFEAKAGFPPAIQGFLTYNSVIVMAQALKIADDAGNLTREGIREALENFGECSEFNGVEILYSSPFSFRENRSGYMEYVPVKIENGQFVSGLEG